MDNLSAEQQLDLFKRCFDAIPRGILITDCQQDDDPIIYANEFFLKTSGYRLDEVVGFNCRFMQGHDTDPDTIERLAQAIRERQQVTVRILNYRKSGETFWNEFTICPVKNAQGKPTHCVGFGREITVAQGKGKS